MTTRKPPNAHRNRISHTTQPLRHAVIIVAVTTSASYYGCVDVRFAYDLHLVDAVKSSTPARDRHWDAARRVWSIPETRVLLLDSYVRSLGHRIDDQRGHQTRGHQTPPPAAVTPTSWAESLLSAVGPTRRDAAYRALARVLHPDMATGDGALMQELNIARAQIGTAA